MHDVRGLEVPEVVIGEVISDIDVRPAVHVVVEENGGAAVGPIDAGRAVTLAEEFAGDLGESAVAVVVKKGIGAPPHEIKVGPAVVVVIAPAAVHAGAFFIRIHVGQAGLGSDIGESAVAVVPIEMIGETLARIGHVEIDPTVTVVVGGRRRGAHAADPGHNVIQWMIENGPMMRIGDAGLECHVFKGSLGWSGRLHRVFTHGLVFLASSRQQREPCKHDR